jgi:two-component system, OmpR family, response regulator MprA
MNAIVAPPASAAGTADQKTWKISSSQKKRILLLDDDPAIRQILLRLLADENYCVSAAADGAEALAFTTTSRYDLVLLDLNLPDESGHEVLSQITADNPELPVVLITARPDQFFLALAAGVGVVLEKPLDFVKLFDTIRDLLEEPPEGQLKGLAKLPLAPIPPERVAVPGK